MFRPALTLLSVGFACAATTVAARSDALLPQPSPAQVAALDQQLTVPIPNQALAAARTEAAPNIKKILGMLACHPDSTPGKYFKQYTTPDMKGIVLGPMGRMKYHDKSQCLTVSRLDNWTIPSNNTIAFRGVYVSDLSGESKDYRYELVKQFDGTWMLRRAGL